MFKGQGWITRLLAGGVFLLTVGTASAGVDKVIAVPWQGDVNKQHTILSGGELGGPVPDSITLEIVNTQCSYGGTWRFYLNGTQVGSVAADPGDTCTCTPPLQSYVINNAALVASGAWNSTGDNILRATMDGAAYYSWVRARVTTGASTKTICIDDYGGGGCTELNLCTASYRNGPVDASNSIIDTSAAAQLKGVIKTTDTSSIWYKWVYGDGTESAVMGPLSGATKYNVETSHTYSGAVGTPFTAKLQVSNTDPFATVMEDAYLMKIEADDINARINIGIDKGLWWLYKQGNQLGVYAGYPHTYDGSPFVVWLQTNYVYTLATPTASAVHAFGINGHKVGGDPDEDPYVEAVRGGINYLVQGYNYYTTLPALNAVAIGPVTHGSVVDNPEAGQAAPNGYGIQVYDWYADHTPYQSGQIMDAIIASGVSPDDLTGRDFTRTDGTVVKNWTYRELLQDMADMHAWGQSDSTGCNGGVCGSWWYGWNYGYPGDNSASQWGAIGMLPAQNPPWNVVVPQWVKDYNANWLAYSMGCSGPSANVTACSYSYFSYNGVAGCAGDSCLQTTTSGMVQMIMDGQTTSDLKWQKGEKYVADRWLNFTHTASDWGGSKTYGWYSFAKAMRLAQPTPVTQLVKTSGASFDWYYGDPTTTACTTEANCEKGLAPRILEIQSTDGSWATGNLTNAPLTTAWMIITLRPTLFAAAPIACFSASPNPSYAGLPISFDPACSGHSEAGKDITNLTLFEWDWDHDGIYDEASTSPAVTSHAFDCAVLPCTYPVSLRVTDDNNPALTATAVVNINITNPPHPPVADADGPYLVSLCATDSLKLDGSGSFDQDEGQFETGCTTCPPDTITAWDWDLVSPLTFDAINKSGEMPTLTSAEIASFFTAGSHNIGLRVSDNTALAYPASGQQNLTNADFGTVDVRNGCLCTLKARAKTGMVQISWIGSTTGNTYNIYRSTSGPNTGFELIRSGYTNPYPLYVDRGLVNGTTYYYRVERVDQTGAACMSNSASGKPVSLK